MKYEYQRLYGDNIEEIIKDRNRLFPDYRIIQIVRLNLNDFEALLEREKEK